MAQCPQHQMPHEGDLMAIATMEAAMWVQRGLGLSPAPALLSCVTLSKWLPSLWPSFSLVV